jgi:hydroxymethylbilane synthase
VVELLGGDAVLVPVSTAGDRRSDVPIHEMGGTGVFVKEVQQAVLDGTADLAVHSAKDLPSETPPGLVLAAVPERGDPRDALVGATLDELPTGAIVGTGSVRRRAQLAALRPDLRFGELRGNIQTRLDKAGEFDAVVIAAVALDRLGLADRIAERLDPAVMVPQVGQGAIALECRAEDAHTLERLWAIDASHVHRTLVAERSFLAELGGGCNLPCGAFARERAHDETELGGGDLLVDALLASLDGRVVLRVTDATDDDAAWLGRDVARRLLDEQGGRRLLEEPSS